MELLEVWAVEKDRKGPNAPTAPLCMKAHSLSAECRSEEPRNEVNAGTKSASRGSMHVSSTAFASSAHLVARSPPSPLLPARSSIFAPSLHPPWYLDGLYQGITHDGLHLGSHDGLLPGWVTGSGANPRLVPP